MAFLCLLELDIRLPENGDLKGKRKQVQSLKAQLRRRFGAAVAETDHHDLWQRATLWVALVGPDQNRLGEAADGVRRFTESRFGDWVALRKTLLSADDLPGE